MKELATNIWYFFLIVLMVYFLLSLVITPIKNGIKAKKTRNIIEKTLKELADEVNKNGKNEEDKS